MIRSILRLARWPWFRPTTTDLLRLRQARAAARTTAQHAKRRRHTDEAQQAHVRATAALLRAEIGGKA